MYRRILSMLLALVMVLGMLPVTALAEGSETVAMEEIVEEIPEETEDFVEEPAAPETEEPAAPEIEETAAPEDEAIEPASAGEDDSGISTAGTIRSGTCGASGSNVEWLLETDGTMTISGTGAMKDYSSSSKKPWDTWQDRILTVVVEDGVTHLGSYSFYGTTNLTSVTMASSVTSTGSDCFTECTSLTDVSLSTNLETLGGGCFRGCSALARIELPSSLETLGDACFSSCSALTDITFPKSLTSLGIQCFYNCTSLVSVQLPYGLTTLPVNCFYGCSGLTDITFPESLTSLEQHCFLYCTALTEITIPWSVSTIGYGAFQSCTNLSKVTFQWDVPSLSTNVFNKVAEFSTAYIPRQASFTYDQREKIQGDGTGEHIRIIEYYNHEHQYELTGTSAATCTEPGYNSYKCFCDSTYDEVRTPATGHTEEVAVSGYPATCTVCGNSVAEQTVIPALGHSNTVTKAGYPATCTQDGLADETYCEVCQTYTGYQEVIPATGHTSETVPGYAATCEETGLTDGAVCADCGITLTEQNTISATGHTEESLPAADPTCDATGLTQGTKCSVCNKILLDQEVIPATGHTNETIPGYPATCTETGLTQGTKCSVCEAILLAQEVVPATGHSATVLLPRKEPTCTETGLTQGFKCSVCDLVVRPQEEIPATGHSATITLARKEPTCTKTGLTEGSKCSVCKAVVKVQETIPATGHTRYTYQDAVAADCENTGMTAGIKCSDCGIKLQTPAEIPALGHYYVNYRCTRCGQVSPYLPSNQTIEESEPNNKDEDANVVGDGFDVSGTLSFGFGGSSDLMDTFVFSLPVRSKVEIRISAGSALLVSVDSAEGEEIYFDYFTASTITRELPAGTYYLTLSTSGYTVYSFNIDITPLEEPLMVPAKPHNIVNVVSGIHVYWKTTSGADKYGLWRSENGKNGTYKWIANPAVPHFTDTDVTSGKTYWYKVTSLDTDTNTHSDKSEAIGLTYVAAPDITLRVNRAVGIGLRWDKITGATGYAIYRKSYDGDDAWVRIATIEGGDTLNWDDTSVKNKNGEVYRYTIRALAGSNMKTLSGCRNTGRTMVRLSSLTLSSAALESSPGSIKCRWPKNAQATGYEVRFMVGSTVYKTFTIGNVNTLTKTFTDLPTGNTYKIQVRSYKKVEGVGSFYSAWSTAKNVTLK